MPPKARSTEEIERRKRLPRGTLLAEQQHLGLKVASHILRCVQSPKDVQFTSRLLAASGMNTAWYGFAQGADYEVQRRRLKLPMLTSGRPDWRPTSEEIFRNSGDKFEEAAVLAGKVVTCVEYRSPRSSDFKKDLGRTIGKGALTLASVPIADSFVNNVELTDADIQLVVRQRGLQALSEGRALGATIGSNPSIAQLANPDSDLAVYWRREAPNGAHDAINVAHELLSCV